MPAVRTGSGAKAGLRHGLEDDEDIEHSVSIVNFRGKFNGNGIRIHQCGACILRNLTLTLDEME